MIWIRDSRLDRVSSSAAEPVQLPSCRLQAEDAINLRWCCSHECDDSCIRDCAQQSGER